MVIEIVPLSEIKRTAWMIALQNFEVAVCFRILELEDSEWSRWRYVVVWLSLVSFDARNVLANVVSLYDFDIFAVGGNLFPDSIILDLVPKNSSRMNFLLMKLIILDHFIRVLSAVGLSPITCRRCLLPVWELLALKLRLVARSN